MGSLVDVPMMRGLSSSSSMRRGKEAGVSMAKEREGRGRGRGEMRWGVGVVVVVVVVCVVGGACGVGVEGVSLGFDWVVTEEDRNDVYSVCGDTTVRRYDGFTFGLAFSTNESFYGHSSQLSPCDRRLSLSSGQLAVFRPKVDEISLLIINATTLNLADFPGYMVAFAGTKFAARSVPHIVKENQHIVTSFTLILDFNKGRLQNLLWKSDGCDSCKGKSSFVCLKEQDCAIALNSCKTLGGKVDCSLSIQIAFSGSDNRDQVLNSWYEISKLHQYSLYGLYNNLKNSLTSQYNKFF